MGEGSPQNGLYYNPASLKPLILSNLLHFCTKSPAPSRLDCVTLWSQNVPQKLVSSKIGPQQVAYLDTVMVRTLEMGPSGRKEATVDIPLIGYFAHEPHPSFPVTIRWATWLHFFLIPWFLPHTIQHQRCPVTKDEHCEPRRTFPVISDFLRCFVIATES